MMVEPPEQERAAIESVVHDLHAQIEHDYPNPPVRRDAHPKAHGTVQAEFVVSRSIPADLRHGVFGTPGARFRAYVRFSNCFHIDPDLKADPRGMAVKLLGVEGEALDGAERGTQDFLAATADAFFVPDMTSYVDFPEAAGKDGVAVILFFFRHRLWRGLRNLARAASVPAMTVTGSVPRAGNRSANVSAVARTSEERGSVRASPFSKRALRKGTPSRTRSSPTAPATLRGRCRTQRAKR